MFRPFNWIDAVNRSSVSNRARAVALAWIGCQADGRTYNTSKHLEASTALKTRAIQRGLGELEDAGFLDRNAYNHAARTSDLTPRASEVTPLNETGNDSTSDLTPRASEVTLLNETENDSTSDLTPRASEVTLCPKTKNVRSDAESVRSDAESVRSDALNRKKETTTTISKSSDHRVSNSDAREDLTRRLLWIFDEYGRSGQATIELLEPLTVLGDIEEIETLIRHHCAKYRRASTPQIVQWTTDKLTQQRTHNRSRPSNAFKTDRDWTALEHIEEI